MLTRVHEKSFIISGSGNLGIETNTRGAGCSECRLICGLLMNITGFLVMWLSSFILASLHEYLSLRFQTGSKQTGLYSHERWLESCRIWEDDTTYVAKTKALICAFVLAYAKRRFSHETAHAFND